MRSRSKRSSEASVTLFPFLAVLICTMGALIVLLVVVVQQARSQAESIAGEKSNEVHTKLAEQARQREEQIAEMELEVQDFQWQAELLRDSHDKTAVALSDHRLRLSHVEDHIRQLRQDLQLAQLSVQQLSSDPMDNNELADAQATLDEIKRQLAEANQELERTREAIRSRPQSYALVPYEGPNGTKRRPIYIECTHRKVTLQPEGVELLSQDFDSPLGPGNPLAAALRAKREYLAANGLIHDSEPYPLMVVRPGGAEAYAAARGAMKAWDSEFGYELVGDDIQLDYSAPDEELTRLLAETIADARKRHAMQKAVAARNRSDTSTSGELVPSRSGGFEVVGGTDRGGSGGNSGLGNGHGNSPRGDGVPTRRGGGTLPGGRFSSADTPDSTSVAGAGVGGNVPINLGGSAAAGGEQPADQAGSVEGTVGETGSAAGSSVSFSNDSQAGSSQSSTGPSQHQIPPQQVANLTDVPANLDDVQALAQSRGSNWALPRGRSSTAIRRPVQIVLTENQITLLPEQGSTEEMHTFQVDHGLRNEIDEVISVIWSRIRDWGIAGTGVYWQPVLHVDVKDRADWRFAEMTRLLENSGLQVKRKLR